MEMHCDALANIATLNPFQNSVPPVHRQDNSGEVELHTWILNLGPPLNLPLESSTWSQVVRIPLLMPQQSQDARLSKEHQVLRHLSRMHASLESHASHAWEGN
jgi:hypothetical protein